MSLIDQRGNTEALPRMSKIEVADRILDWVARRWQ